MRMLVTLFLIVFAYSAFAEEARVVKGYSGYSIVVYESQETGIVVQDGLKLKLTTAELAQIIDNKESVRLGQKTRPVGWKNFYTLVQETSSTHQAVLDGKAIKKVSRQTKEKEESFSPFFILVWIYFCLLVAFMHSKRSRGFTSVAVALVSLLASIASNIDTAYSAAIFAASLAFIATFFAAGTWRVYALWSRILMITGGVLMLIASVEMFFLV